MDSLQPPSHANDIFSLSDQVLADRLQFIEEIGFGNWGSVWLCRPKPSSSSRSSPTKYDRVKIAVKLVHRSKTQTTAARVRSLWNEMKVVRSLKHEPHPSIIPFYSFIITPSYALITMAFLPRLVPVEVGEPVAKHWFRSLLSGVEFLHKRGVVHNDIKPANILLSEEDVPVLVDFGFAEKYDENSSKAFKSNLAYGTPEYLSPERARGLYHDTRKSDVWSLGITFFEILVGRTPFEYVEGEQFSTKEDLEKYWARTLRGRWVGSWKISRSVEKMLRRMIAPNADVRCTASDAMEDSYWTNKEPSRSAHRKSASLSQAAFSAMSIDMDTSKLLDIVSPFTTRTLKDRKEPSNKLHNKENMASPPTTRKVDNASVKLKQESSSTIASHAKHVRSQSQPKLQLPTAQNQANASTTKTPGLKPLVFAPLAPIKGSTTSSMVITPPVKSTSGTGKENSAPGSSSKTKLTRATSDIRTRRPAGPRKAPATPERQKGTPPTKVNHSRNVDTENAMVKPKENQGRQGRVLVDLSMNTNLESRNRSNETQDRDASGISSYTGKSSVKERWLDWERERERLREMDRLQERIKEAEEEREKEKVRQQEEIEIKAALEEEREKERQRQREREAEERRERLEEELKDIQNRRSQVASPTSSEGGFATLVDAEVNLGLRNGLPRPRAFESGLSVLKQSLMASIEKGVQLYKTSTSLAYIAKQSTKAHSGEDFDESRRDTSMRESWEDESLVRKANSSLPAVRLAIRNERLAHDNNADRMSIWIRNVEKVVEDARRGFAAAPVSSEILAPLPVAPSRRVSQRRTQRLPRKILAANEIFSDDGEAGSSLADQTRSQYTTANNSITIPESSLSPIASDQVNQAPSSPTRARRATVISRSPETARKDAHSSEVDSGSPSKSKEKSRSQGDLLMQPITPLRKLEMELEKLSTPVPPIRLSAVVDRSLFIASPSTTEEMIVETDDLESSPFRVVEPYPSKIVTGSRSLDSPNTKRRIESKYEQLVTSTTGVKKVGLGYQSDMRGAIVNMAVPDLYASVSKRNHTFFHSTRRAMPPPVSSEDWRKTASVDELGMMTTPAKLEHGADLSKDDRSGTASVVRRAFKMMTGKTVSKRLSRIA